MNVTKVSISLALAGVALAAAAASLPSGLRAADHGDSPAVRVDTRLDINDVYVFQSPQTPTNTVLIMTVCPVAGITGPKQFTPGARYQFAIDTNGDAVENQTFTMVFGKPLADGHQAYTLTGPNRLKVRGTTDDLGVTAGTGGKVFAGIRDDPFFFDLIGFRRGLAFSAQTSRNFFDGLNTMSIVLEVPTASFDATNIGVWARTFKGRKQVDRMGRPAINTVLIGAAKKDAFNAGMPRNDVAAFKTEMVANLKAAPLSRSDTDANALAAILLPDILTYDTSNSGGFLNGRKLTDDVIDAELGILSNNVVTTDFVGNDSTFLQVFPYLGVVN
ncbi:MAG: DUF4331 domain-containing protein [Planctomycetes bacterium]|nr:DUF4331 domain-containing protein [Planctomycetota bacterium]